MEQYTVLYRIESIQAPSDHPFGFMCWAEDADHAEEQCLNACPDCDVVWVLDTDDYRIALNNFYAEGLTD